MILRDYQDAAVRALLAHIQYQQGNPCISIPTGGGKSIILAKFIEECQKKWPGIKTIVLAHVKELVRQNSEKMLTVCPDADVGIYSAGLNQRDTEHDILFAGIQSVYNKTYTGLGGKDLIIIDEAHRIPQEGEGMYRNFLMEQWKLQKEIKRQPRIVGLTATPYRMKTGLLCGAGEILTKIVYEANIHNLILDGYLSKPVSQRTEFKPQLSGVKIQAGDFVGAELDMLMGKDELVEHHAQEIFAAGEDRKGILAFCSGISHAEKITSALEKLGVSVALVHSQISKADRDSRIQKFSEQNIKCLVNVSVLTEGFDAPHIDLIALLRPTRSPGLYSQMCGRGLRIAEGKAGCLILDFGMNISRHGPIDKIKVVEIKSIEGKAPKKSCPVCGFSEIPAGSRYCPECEHEFEFVDTPLNANASLQKILSESEWYVVKDVDYQHHLNLKKGTETLRVDYRCGVRTFSEWVCLNHTGFPRLKAERWWARACENGASAPKDIILALETAQNGGLLQPDKILVDESGKYPNILQHDYFNEIRNVA
jgi:DNA repair protein RadD